MSTDIGLPCGWSAFHFLAKFCFPLDFWGVCFPSISVSRQSFSFVFFSESSPQISKRSKAYRRLEPSRLESSLDLVLLWIARPPFRSTPVLSATFRLEGSYLRVVPRICAWSHGTQSANLELFMPHFHNQGVCPAYGHIPGVSDLPKFIGHLIKFFDILPKLSVLVECVPCPSPDTILKNHFRQPIDENVLI